MTGPGHSASGPPDSFQLSKFSPLRLFNSATLGEREDYRSGVSQFKMCFVGKPQPAPTPVPFKLQGLGGAKFGNIGKVFTGESTLVASDYPEFLARQFLVDGGEELDWPRLESASSSLNCWTHFMGSPVWQEIV